MPSNFNPNNRNYFKEFYQERPITPRSFNTLKKYNMILIPPEISGKSYNIYAMVNRISPSINNYYNVSTYIFSPTHIYYNTNQQNYVNLAHGRQFVTGPSVTYKLNQSDLRKLLVYKPLPTNRLISQIVDYNTQTPFNEKSWNNLLTHLFKFSPSVYEYFIKNATSRINKLRTNSRFNLHEHLSRILNFIHRKLNQRRMQNEILNRMNRNRSRNQNININLTFRSFEVMMNEEYRKKVKLLLSQNNTNWKKVVESMNEDELYAMYVAVKNLINKNKSISNNNKNRLMNFHNLMNRKLNFFNRI